MGEIEILSYSDGKLERTLKLMPDEALVALRVNGQDWISLYCTPQNLRELTLGFLYLEGVINGLEDVATLRVCEDLKVVEVVLYRDVVLPARRVITSGCGQGITHLAGDVDFRLEGGPHLAPDRILSLMRELYRLSTSYRQSGGIHSSGISDGERILWVAEDIGRHNTLDKIKGHCLLEGIETGGKVILTTGRISTEMLVKAARMGVPFLVSRTSPTAQAAELAERWGITLVGYARGTGLRVYSHPERVLLLKK